MTREDWRAVAAIAGCTLLVLGSLVLSRHALVVAGLLIAGALFLLLWPPTRQTERPDA